MQDAPRPLIHDDDSPLVFQKGCPLCEHNDPELERELSAFATIMLEFLIEKHDQAKRHNAGPVDTSGTSPTLKERSNQ